MHTKPLVLIADDNAELRHALEARLTQSGFDVVSAGNAGAAIGLFDHRRPDAAVLDVQMPDSDGFSVCQHIRELGSRIPVFFLTGTTEDIVRRHLDKLTARAGGNHFIPMPCDGKSLAMMLHKALQAPGGPGPSAPPA